MCFHPGASCRRPAGRGIMQLAAAARPTFPVDLLLDAITNPRARTANGTLNGTALCMACTADAPCCRKSCGAAAGKLMRIRIFYSFTAQSWL